MRPFRFFAIVEVGMTGWLAVFAAGLFEIAWAFGLKYSDGLTRFWPTLATALAILASFALMAFALRSLPFGTAYAIWTGIGAAGSIVVVIPVNQPRLLAGENSCIRVMSTEYSPVTAKPTKKRQTTK